MHFVLLRMNECKNTDMCPYYIAVKCVYVNDVKIMLGLYVINNVKKYSREKIMGARVQLI